VIGASFFRRIFASRERRPSPPAGAEGPDPAPPLEPGEETPEIVAPEITDVLDLHAFRPEDVTSVVGEFLSAARERGIGRVRIIHGKGIGVQRARVRALLEARPDVISFGDAPDASGWGATVAVLRAGPRRGCGD
jgi:dsDNA-specific endonuclease/ATPase MutS2